MVRHMKVLLLAFVVALGVVQQLKMLTMIVTLKLLLLVLFLSIFDAL